MSGWWDPWAVDDRRIEITPLPGRLYRMLSPYCVRVPSGVIERSAFHITIEYGFVLDFSSVPRMLWSWAPPMGMYTPAAAIHDWGYRMQCRYPLTRKDWDVIFYAHMRACGVRRTQAWMKYRAVRMAGGRSWRRWRDYPCGAPLDLREAR